MDWIDEFIERRRPVIDLSVFFEIHLKWEERYNPQTKKLFPSLFIYPKSERETHQNEDDFLIFNNTRYAETPEDFKLIFERELKNVGEKDSDNFFRQWLIVEFEKLIDPVKNNFHDNFSLLKRSHKFLKWLKKEDTNTIPEKLGKILPELHYALDKKVWECDLETTMKVFNFENTEKYDFTILPKQTSNLHYLLHKLYAYLRPANSNKKEWAKPFLNRYLGTIGKFSQNTKVNPSDNKKEIDTIFDRYMQE